MGHMCFPQSTMCGRFLDSVSEFLGGLHPIGIVSVCLGSDMMRFGDEFVVCDVQSFSQVSVTDEVCLSLAVMMLNCTIRLSVLERLSKKLHRTLRNEFLGVSSVNVTARKVVDIAEKVREPSWPSFCKKLFVVHESHRDPDVDCGTGNC